MTARIQYRCKGKVVLLGIRELDIAMAAGFDLDFITFRCKHPKCGEIFEKSLGDLAGAEEVICPRCGTAAQIGEENHLLAAAKVAEKAAYADKTAG